MLMTTPRPTAQIIPFPAGGHGADRRSPALEVAALDRPRVSYDSWYHDEAIREAQLPAKR